MAQIERVTAKAHTHCCFRQTSACTASEVAVAVFEAEVVGAHSRIGSADHLGNLFLDLSRAVKRAGRSLAAAVMAIDGSYCCHQYSHLMNRLHSASSKRVRAHKTESG